MDGGSYLLRLRGGGGYGSGVGRWHAGLSAAWGHLGSLSDDWVGLGASSRVDFSDDVLQS